MLRFDDPVSFVQGTTPSVRRAWSALDIVSVGDLLQAAPRRYDDFSRTSLVRDLEVGAIVTLRGKVVTCSKLSSFRKRFQIIRLVMADDTGKISATFFNQPWILTELVPGREIFLSGKVTIHPRYGKSLANPLWEPAEAKTLAAGKLAPVYGLAGTLAQKTYRRLIAYALENLEALPETLNASTIEALQLPDRRKAFSFVHDPASLEEVELGRRRLAFEELLAYQLALRSARLEADEAGGVPIPFDESFAKRFVQSLPFPLTADQKRSVWTALQDMQKTRPMRRLLQGDVGSGKTVVAAFLAAHVVRAQHSAALLAPTDLLARQHAATWRRFLATHQIPIILITRTDKRWIMEREEKVITNTDIETFVDQGEAVFIGTHALLEARRLPKDLALAIVDEQHRFGVGQREALTVSARADGRIPHFFSMTATPIPRSLALTFYGDLDVSVLREKPAGRVPIITKTCIGNRREQAYTAIVEAVKRGERAFVVCPLIDPSDALGVRSATEEWKRLANGPLKGLRVGLLHGRLKPLDKDRVMNEFAKGELDVLVATAVIEVGIDVPEATVMAIEGAERFGLAQLHQFRGRVGRSHRPSFCFLMTDVEGDSLDRLKLLERIEDGLRLSEEDLKRRGTGNLLGTMQSGHDVFKAARMTDLELMNAAKEEAEKMLADSNNLVKFPYWEARIKSLRSTAHLE